MMQRIVCAAIKNTDSELVIAGVRHFDMVMHAVIKALDPIQATSWEQGFLDNYGDFFSREDSAKIAFQSGQVKSPPSGGRLFSEDLY